MLYTVHRLFSNTLTVYTTVVVTLILHINYQQAKTNGIKCEWYEPTCLSYIFKWNLEWMGIAIMVEFGLLYIVAVTRLAIYFRRRDARNKI